MTKKEFEISKAMAKIESLNADLQCHENNLVQGLANEVDEHIQKIKAILEE